MSDKQTDAQYASPKKRSKIAMRISIFIHIVTAVFILGCVPYLLMTQRGRLLINSPGRSFEMFIGDIAQDIVDVRYYTSPWFGGSSYLNHDNVFVVVKIDPIYTFSVGYAASAYRIQEPGYSFPGLASIYYPTENHSQMAGTMKITVHMNKKLSQNQLNGRYTFWSWMTGKECQDGQTKTHEQGASHDLAMPGQTLEDFRPRPR